jgi:hypothetical protein
MIIRRAQLASLQLRQEAEFESYLLGLVREEFPDAAQGRDDESLLTYIRPALGRCRELYEIEEENPLAKYVYLTFLLGPGFDAIPEQDWIPATLRQQRPAAERMEIVMAGIIHHLENETGQLRLAEDADAQTTPAEGKAETTASGSRQSQAG